MKQFAAALAAMALLCLWQTPPVVAEPFPEYIESADPVDPPYTSNDKIPLVRGGHIMWVPGTQIVTPDSNQEITNKKIDCALNDCLNLPGGNSLEPIAPNSVLANTTGVTALPGAAPLPDCPDIDGKHYNYSGGHFTCGVTGDGVGGTVLAPIAANSMLANTTGASAVPTAEPLPDCPDTDGKHWNYTGGLLLCGDSTVEEPLTVSNVTNTVLNTTTLNLDPKSFGVDGSGGAALITSTLQQSDHTGANYTVIADDVPSVILVGPHTYLLPQAGTIGFGDRAEVCFLHNGATGNATINTSTSVFKGATNTTTLTLQPGGWACPVSDGVNYNTTVGHYAQEVDYTFSWDAARDPNKRVIFTAPRAMVVTGIRGTVADAVGAAATVAIYKAADATPCTSGGAAVIQHSGTFNANGTAATNQTLTLVGGSGNNLAAGDRLCAVTTGGANWTGGVGNGGITITARAL